MTGEELNILSKIKVRPVEEQRDYLLEQNMLLAGKIATLEKENAELKKLKRECETSLCRAEYQYNYEQLTKSKELLKKLLSAYTTYADSFDDRDNEIVEEAEQFLKDVGKVK